MDNIKYNNKDITDEDVYRICKLTNCHNFIMKMGGYNHIIKSKSELSNGQIQLLTIARTMAQNAPLLILDEATSDVDAFTEIKIQDAMTKITKNRTCFIIAHHLATIKNADLILVMDNGKIVERGKHGDLLSKGGLYAKIYYAQFCQ